jgi:hypothetical protein
VSEGRSRRARCRRRSNIGQHSTRHWTLDTNVIFAYFLHAFLFDIINNQVAELILGGKQDFVSVSVSFF